MNQKENVKDNGESVDETKAQSLGTLEEFRKEMLMKAGLPVRESVIVDPVIPPVVSAVESSKDVDGMKLNPVKKESVEAGAVEPVVLKAVDGVSADDIEKLIVKRKTRLFGKHEKLEDLSIADLEILRQQKVREEQVEKNRLEDERTLAQMRQDKKEYYSMLRNRYKMSEPFDARLAAFYGKRLPEIRMLLELYGLKIIDKKHVFSDGEFESFYEQSREKGVRCPYDTFAFHMKQGIVVRSSADEHRKDLWERVMKE